MLNPLLKSRFT